jgi:hypothetical protein
VNEKLVINLLAQIEGLAATIKIKLEGNKFWEGEAEKEIRRLCGLANELEREGMK